MVIHRTLIDKDDYHHKEPDDICDNIELWIAARKYQVLNPSNFGLNPLDITDYLRPEVFSMYHRFIDIWFSGRMST